MNKLSECINNAAFSNVNVEFEIPIHLTFYRFFLGICISIFLFLGYSCKKEINRKNTITTYEKRLPRPEWISHFPAVFDGNWDEMAIFMQRKGGAGVWQEDNYEKEHTEEAVKKLKEAGVTLDIIHFYKAYGLKAEKEHMEDSKKLALLLKKYGIKVGVYVGSTFGYETFLLENPEAKEWIVPDYMGQPVWYYDQTFRKRVYFHHPEYKEYIKKVLKIAIEDWKADLIFFDNPANQGLPPVFFHPLAIENFRIYLRNKYSEGMLKKRFGFSDISYVEPPKYDNPMSTIDDPLFQEWTDFRCQQLADYYGEMEVYIRNLNPEVAVTINPHGLSGQNTMWDQSLDFPKILSHTDYFLTEGEEANLTDDGILISKIRTFKMAQTLKNRVITYTSNSKLEMAEAMAYDFQSIGMVGYGLSTDALPEEQKDYIRFFHKNFDHYDNIRNVADVAVLHSYATMAYNNDLPYQSTFLFEQALIQGKIPFDIIFDDNLKNLSKYKVLVLADQECLSDEKLDLIRNFVKKGGGLVATEHTSFYTEWRQRRLEFGLYDLFRINAPVEHRPGNNASETLNVPMQKNQVGEGRVVYIPHIKPTILKAMTKSMTSQYWKLPTNFEEIIESVKWASAYNLSLRIEAPLTTTMELNQKIDDSSLALHLVNYDYKNSVVNNIKIDVKVPADKKVLQVTVLTPDNKTTETIHFEEKEERVVFTVPKLSVYDLVVIKLK